MQSLLRRILLLCSAFLSGVFYAKADALATALGDTSLTWTVGGAGNWQAGFLPLDSSVKGVRWSGLAAGTTGLLQTTVAGPGQLLCVCYNGDDPRYPPLFVEGMPVSVSFENARTSLMLIELAAGSHTLTWKPVSQFFLGSVQWQPGVTAGLADGLDTSSSVVVAQYEDGDGWFRITGPAVGGDMISGTFDYGPGAISFFAEGPGRLVMNLRGDDQEYSASVAGPESSISFHGWGGASNAWRPHSTLLTAAGRRCVQFTFENCDECAGAIDLDAVTLEPVASFVSQVLSTDSSREWRLSEGWKISPEGLNDFGAPDAGRIENQTGGPSWIETDVTGPVLAELNAAFQRSGQGVAVTLNGAEVPVIRNFIGIASRETLRARVPEGLHRVRWTITGGNVLKVDRFRAHPLIPPDALGVSGGPGPELYALLDANEARVESTGSGRNGMAVSVVAPGTRTMLALLPPGPGGLFRIWKKGSGNLNSSGALFTVFENGQAGSAAWIPMEAILPASAAWRSFAFQATPFFLSTLFLDDLTFDSSQLSLADALDDAVEGAAWRSDRALALRTERHSVNGDAVFLLDTAAWVERDAAGPAVFRASGPPTLDGTTTLMATRSGYHVFVPPGRHTLRWTGPMVLDRAGWEPLTTLSEALDIKPGGLSASPDVFGVRFPADNGSNSGGAAIFSPARPDAPAWMQKTFTGPAQVIWGQTGNLNGGGLRCLLDGQPVGFGLEGVMVPDAGEHTIRWDWPESTVHWMTRLSVSTPAFLRSGIVFASLNGWTSSWKQTGEGFDFSLYCDREALLETEITGPADLSFSTDSDLILDVPGLLWRNVSAGLLWNGPAVLSLPEGTHRIRWRCQPFTSLSGFGVARPGQLASAIPPGPAGWKWSALREGQSNLKRLSVAMPGGGAVMFQWDRWPWWQWWGHEYLQLQHNWVPTELEGQGLIAPARFVWLPPGPNFINWTGEDALTSAEFQPSPEEPLALVLPAGITPDRFSGEAWKGFFTPGGVQAVSPPDGLAPGTASWMEAVASGPLKLVIAPVLLTNDARAAVFLDGNLAASAEFPTSQAMSIPLTGYPQRIRLEISRSANQEPVLAAGYFRVISVTPRPAMDVAMNTPGITWRVSQVPYIPDNRGAHSVDDWDVWLEAAIPGPAALHLQHRGGYQSVSVNGQTLIGADYASYGFHQGAALMLPAGENRVRWSGSGYVPPVTLLPSAADFAAGFGPLNAPWFISRSAAGPDWESTGADHYDGAPALKTSRNSRLQLPVHGPGTLHFAWKSDATGPNKRARCWLDGRVLLSAGESSSPWTEEVIRVPAGWHQVLWTTYDSSAALDAIRWMPDAGFAAWAAANIPQWTDRYPLFDGDGDGIPAFLEFAVGRSPVLPDPIHPLVSWNSLEQRASVTFPAAALPGDQVRLVLETSADLRTWTPAAPGTITTHAGSQTLRLLPPAKFARIKATLPP